jgi:hypothetical protein
VKEARYFEYGIIYIDSSLIIVFDGCNKGRKTMCRLVETWSKRNDRLSVA